MTETSEEEMAQKALKAMQEEYIEFYIDKKDISTEDLEKALLSAVDVDILQCEHQIPPSRK